MAFSPRFGSRQQIMPVTFLQGDDFAARVNIFVPALIPDKQHPLFGKMKVSKYFLRYPNINMKC